MTSGGLDTTIIICTKGGLTLTRSSTLTSPRIASTGEVNLLVPLALVGFLVVSFWEKLHFSDVSCNSHAIKNSFINRTQHYSHFWTALCMWWVQCALAFTYGEAVRIWACLRPTALMALLGWGCHVRPGSHSASFSPNSNEIDDQIGCAVPRLLSFKIIFVIGMLT